MCHADFAGALARLRFVRRSPATLCIPPRNRPPYRFSKASTEVLRLRRASAHRLTLTISIATRTTSPSIKHRNTKIVPSFTSSTTSSNPRKAVVMRSLPASTSVEVKLPPMNSHRAVEIIPIDPKAVVVAGTIEVGLVEAVRRGSIVNSPSFSAGAALTFATVRIFFFAGATSPSRSVWHCGRQLHREPQPPSPHCH